MSLKNFQHYLVEELKRRQKADSGYSLRKFAKFLDLEPSFLSKILRGQRSVTVALLRSKGVKLNLSDSEIQLFELELLKNYEPPKKRRNPKKAHFSELTLEKVSLIAGWHYFCILEIFAVSGVRPSTRTLAKLLGMTEVDVGLAVSRLTELKLLVNSETNEGKPPNNFNNKVKDNPFSTRELKQIQRQFIVKSIEALETVSLEKRDHSGMTLAVAEKDLPEAKKMIKSFRRRFMTKLQNEQKPDRIYQLSIAFFPLTGNLDLK